VVGKVLLALLLTLALVGCGTSGQDGAAVSGVSTSDHDGYNGVLLDEPYVVPHVRLTDTDGQPFDLADQRKRTLVFFGYTKCPDICQVVMSTIASSIARLSDAEQAKVQVVFVTTDPERDTESVLRTYLDHFNPAFVGVTGPIDKIDELGKPMGVFIKKGQKLASGGYEVDHTANVISVRDGKGDLVWTASTSQSDMAADLEKMLKADA
jgi:protein SCO1/2